MGIKIYSINNSLVIEDSPIRQIIKYNDIQSVIIYNVNETYNNQLDFYLEGPIIYEEMKNKWWSKLLFNLYLSTHKDRYKIEISYVDDLLILILDELYGNLINVSIPNDLNESMFWKTRDSSYNIPGFKLVYSKLGLGLYDTLKKYKKVINL